MTAKELLLLTLILLGIYCVIQSIIGFAGILDHKAYEAFVLGKKGIHDLVSDENSLSMILFWYYALPILSSLWYAIFGYLLIKHNDGIAGKLLNKTDKEAQLSFAAHQRLLFLLAIIIIGIITMVMGMPAILSKIDEIMFQGGISSEMSSETKTISHYYWATWLPIIDPIIRIVISFYLITAGRHQYKLFALIRNAVRHL